jgi:uncharacterized membrane protein HdeD (DUF308 family)
VPINLSEVLRQASPVVSAVVAALLFILGILIITYPVLLTWVVGIGLILAGIALLTFAFTSGRRSAY